MTTTPDHKPQTDDAPTPRHSRLCAVLTLIGLVGVALWGFATIFTPATTDDDAADALPISDGPAPDDADFNAMDDADFAMPDMPAAPVAARPDSAAVADDSTAADTAAAEPHVVPADSVPAPKPEPLPEPLPLPADTADA
ncbi:MAG: hypothetical protein SPI92_06010 [Alloprevotella sp.]|nr:hypothetical protein [Bacteroidales bacterium]MDY6033345.1 hypothetical protein [Alloprevotella sp.]